MPELISYSIVIPVFNEEAVLPVLLRRIDELLARLQEQVEVIFVDDGSVDSGPIVLQSLARRDPRFRRATRSSSWTPICRIRRRSLRS
jgi:polyisoprenyl-phosphate glycosyltransferase